MIYSDNASPVVERKIHFSNWRRSLLPLWLLVALLDVGKEGGGEGEERELRIEAASKKGFDAASKIEVSNRYDLSDKS